MSQTNFSRSAYRNINNIAIQIDNTDFETLDDSVKKRIKEDSNVFHLLNITNIAELRESCNGPTAGALPCFNFNKNCMGDVVNGFCEKCFLVVTRALICPFVDVNVGTCAVARLLPYSTEEFRSEVKIFPILSMQGRFQPHELEPLNNCRDSQTSNHLMELLANMSVPFTQVQNLVLTRLIQFKQAHEPMMANYLKMMNNRTIRLWFTRQYTPNNKKSAYFYTNAVEIEGQKVYTAKLSEFENIIDIYMLSLFATSTFTEGTTTLLAIPNVLVVDGWLRYGYGHGVSPFPTKVDARFSCHHIASSSFINKVETREITPLAPLIVDGKTDGPFESQLTVAPLATNTTIKVEGLDALKCNNAIYNNTL